MYQSQKQKRITKYQAIELVHNLQKLMN